MPLERPTTNEVKGQMDVAPWCPLCLLADMDSGMRSTRRLPRTCVVRLDDSTVLGDPQRWCRHVRARRRATWWTGSRGAAAGVVAQPSTFVVPPPQQRGGIPAFAAGAVAAACTIGRAVAARRNRQSLQTVHLNRTMSSTGVEALACAMRCRAAGVHSATSTIGMDGSGPQARSGSLRALGARRACAAPASRGHPGDVGNPGPWRRVSARQAIA
jgi:hypothetical protein